MDQSMGFILADCCSPGRVREQSRDALTGGYRRRYPDPGRRDGCLHCDTASRLTACPTSGSHRSS